MASLKEVRNRITSVGSTMQITSAMKMVSAAKLKRAQDAVTQMRPYANKMKEILENVSGSSENAYSRKGSGKNVLIVAITSNRGLAGGFNANVVKKTWSLIKQEYAGNTVMVLPIGKKAFDAFRRTEHAMKSDQGLADNYNDIYDGLTFDKAADVANKIMAAFVNKEFDNVILVYNQFKNAAVQIIQAEQYLPIAPPSGNAKTFTSDYIYEPSQEFIMNDLIPRSLKAQLFKAILDSFASEHGARMTAMHKATDNAKDLLKSLKISYNKARQASITNEILEIVGGAEALNN